MEFAITAVWLMTPTSLLLVGICFLVLHERGGGRCALLDCRSRRYFGSIAALLAGSLRSFLVAISVSFRDAVDQLDRVCALAWITTRLLKPGSFQTWIRLGFGTGLIGSFTTFSTFSLETVELLKRDLWGVALLYVLLSLWGGLLMAWVGCRIARSQLQKRAKEAESA